MPLCFHSLRGPLVTCHILLEDLAIHLIDSGFIRDVKRLELWLNGNGRSLSELRTVLLTHGHLDHTLNAAELKARTGCRILAPALDRDHVAGRHSYRGISRICGMLEACGRAALRYQPPEVDEWFAPGDELDLWGGLEVVHLPGHTAGHCGFFQRKMRLLFCGDLFASQYGAPRVPPPWFNVDQERCRQSLDRALALKPAGLILNHGRQGTPAQHLEDLQRLLKKTRRGGQGIS